MNIKSLLERGLEKLWRATFPLRRPLQQKLDAYFFRVLRRHSLDDIEAILHCQLDAHLSRLPRPHSLEEIEAILDRRLSAHLSQWQRPADYFLSGAEEMMALMDHLVRELTYLQRQHEELRAAVKELASDFDRVVRGGESQAEDVRPPTASLSAARAKASSRNDAITAA